MKAQFTSRHGTAALFLGAAILYGAPSAHACGDTPYLGSVCLTAISFCPAGFYEANGALLPISQNTALFALLGTTYGGDGMTNFALPDLRGRTPVGSGQGPGLASVTQGDKRGAENVTLGSVNLPAHSHSLQALAADGSGTAMPGASLANPVASYRGMDLSSSAYATSGIPVTLAPTSIGTTGSGQPVTNLPPQLGMRYCIALQGLFPPQN